ncbi:hypothetical protein AA313_de0202907 [Arthrobotrys entomopaga]|nr:hypothetical protein AA313_de0202907 [Arthrobotrys entomopaga]
MCPEGYGCVCRNFWYSQCLPTASYATDCPPASRYWGCASTLTKDTGEYSQCGGICWDLLNSPKACGAGFACWTKTQDGYEAPGQYAMCAPTRPDEHYQATPQSLCYPVPYTYTLGDDPTCAGAATPQTLAANEDLENVQVADTGPQTMWGQCGGLNWKGPSSCADGGACVSQNLWYSQCLSAKRKEKKSATPVRNPAAITTPVRKLTQRDLLGPAQPGSKPRLYR